MEGLSEVLKLRNSTRINEQCLELQKKKKKKNDVSKIKVSYVCKLLYFYPHIDVFASSSSIKLATLHNLRF